MQRPETPIVEAPASLASSSAGYTPQLVLLSVFFLVLLPWLNPFAPGPAPGVVPYLFSALCAGVLLLVVSLGSAQVPASLSDGKWLQAFAWAWVAAAVVSAGIGMVQYAGASRFFDPWFNQTRMGEAFGNMRQRNHFATLLNIGLVALLWLMHSVQTQWKLVAAMGAAVLLGAANAASSSRTGLAQLIVLVLMLLGWYLTQRHKANPNATNATNAASNTNNTVGMLLLSAVVSYAVAVYALPRVIGLDASVLSRLNTAGDGCSSRLILWHNVLDLVAQKPWLGWGWGELDFAHFVTLYPGDRFCEILDNAHNLPLHLAVEFGVPMALALCGLALWLTLRAQPWREADAARQMAWCFVVLIAIHSMLEYPLWYGPFQMTLAAAIWILWKHSAVSRTHESSPSVAQKNIRKIATIGYPIMFLAIFIIATAAFTAWDYHRISQLYLSPDQRASGYQTNTMDKVKDSLLFQGPVQFAMLPAIDLTPKSASVVNELAKEVMHFSPEPRVVQKVIESAVMLGRDDEAKFYLERYRAAYPAEHARWAAQPN